MKIDSGFLPILGASPKVLVLGTMPSVQSLQAQQYYAHPRNTFWPIMGQLLAFDPGLSYVERQHRVTERGIAIWDVIQCCHRAGSLDADINHSTLVPNDFSALLAASSSIRLIAFNGKVAARLFHRYVETSRQGHCFTGAKQVLPSTSPAHASMTFDQKLSIWKCLLDYS